MTMTSTWAPICKSEEQDDGTIYVYGKATDDSLDRDFQRCDPNWLNQAMPEWYSSGANIREQHDSKRAVGVGVDHEIAPDGHYIKAHVVDPVAVLKTKAGVLKGFSIGIANPKVEKSTDAPNGLINGGNIIEVSLCDRPANPGCMLQLAKSAEPGMTIAAGDYDEERGLVKCQELIESEKSEEPELEKDASWAEQATEAALNGGHGCGCCNECICDTGKTVDVEITKADGTAETLAFNYDRDLALELVKAADNPETATNVLAGITVPPTAPPPEINDILRAKAAIAIIGQLIQGEAVNLATRPYQDCDIELLMQAVHALRCFMCREKNEPGNGDGTQVELSIVEAAGKSADPEITKDAEKPYGDVEYADPGYQKDGKKRYPIDTEKHVRAALSYIGQERNADEYSSDQLKKVKARIMAAAKKFGIDSDSDKAVESDEAIEKTETVEEPVEKTEATEEVTEKTEDAEVEKADEPEITKAAAVEEAIPSEDALNKAIAAALEKALSEDELEKSDNPIRKTVTAIVEAATKSAAEAVTDVTARLEKVEQMATPGGPALRRTEVERTQARKTDLELEIARNKALAKAADDPILRKGYTMKAAQLEAEIRAL